MIILKSKKYIINYFLLLDYDYIKEQKVIDNIIFEFYAKKFNFPNSLKKALDE